MRDTIRQGAGRNFRACSCTKKVSTVPLFDRHAKKTTPAACYAAAAKVRTPGEIYGLMERGGQLRATGATRMNDTSSRSHAVFIIIVEQVIQSQCCRKHQLENTHPEGFAAGSAWLLQGRASSRTGFFTNSGFFCLKHLLWSRTFWSRTFWSKTCLPPAETLRGVCTAFLARAGLPPQ